MIQYITAREAAQKWNITQRRVSILCAENRIPDAAMLGNMWIIPYDAKKPEDGRKTKFAKSEAQAHPFIKWAGGKGQLLKTIQQNLPAGLGSTITKYAEPFVGGGAVLFSLLEQYSFEEVYICDNNKELINAYNVIKLHCSELVSYLQTMQTRYNELDSILEKQDYFYIQRDLFNNTELCLETQIQKAALFVFLNKTCFNGLYRVNKKGLFNVPFGKHKTPTICDFDNLFKVSTALQNVSIHSCDYQEVLNFADEHTFVYFDPPYRPLSTTSGFVSYTEEQFDDSNQIELADLFKRLSSLGAFVLLSNSDPHNTNPDDDFFDDLYEDYTIVRVDAARAINSKASSRGKIKEILVKNY